MATAGDGRAVPDREKDERVSGDISSKVKIEKLQAPIS